MSGAIAATSPPDERSLRQRPDTEEMETPIGGVIALCRHRYVRTLFALAVVGVWFRGEGMALTWPWTPGGGAS